MKTEILVIDDNADIRFLICNILQENGFIIRSPANFDQAENEINQSLPNLAIVDIKLDKSDLIISNYFIHLYIQTKDSKFLIKYINL